MSRNLSFRRFVVILKGEVGAEQAGMRLDDGATALFRPLSKSRIRRIIDLGGCTVNEALTRVASRTLKEGDVITLGVMEPERYREFSLTPEAILYEDADVLALCKPAGINSQRTPYQLKGTVEHAVGKYLGTLGGNEPVRIIHRLDRGTSGVMLFPKNRRAAARLSEQLKTGRIGKLYLALVTGIPVENEWCVDAPIAKIGTSRYGVNQPGKEARTEFRIIAAGGGACLVEARPLTGRTHQIRVHLAHSGLPIVGDPVYGTVSASRMMLHCRSMAFDDGDGKLTTVSAMPDETFARICGDYGIAV